MKHIARSTGNNEWYTPHHIIDRVRRVMGGIDYDPASCDVAQEYIQAGIYHTIDDDGLNQEWSGRVFMNPPYARPLTQRFVKHLLRSDKVTEYITLTNDSTDTRWAHLLMNDAYFICFLKGRIQFLSGNADLKPGSPLRGTMICYRGKNHRRFYEEFFELGVVLSLDN